MKRKIYVVYFMDDYMEEFKSREEAKEFINDCVDFDKREHNPFGAKKSNYKIVVEYDN